MFLIPWSFAAMLIAFMDTIDFRLAKSVFKHKNADVWDPHRSGTLMKLWMNWIRLDPWHIAKLGVIVCLSLTVILYKPLWGVLDLQLFVIRGWILDACTLALLWFISFETVWKLLYKP